jgi:hypothetical protein
MPLLFYTRPDCHLCDLAWDLLLEAGLDREVNMVNIEEDVQLLRRYCLEIPVIRDPDLGRELGWPFNQDDLRNSFGVSAS